jgi:hypothetical protein
MSETYYPRHSELDTQADRELDAAQERIRELEAQIRTVAERQREACAVRLHRLLHQKQATAVWVGADEILATPLVTEGEP